MEFVIRPVKAEKKEFNPDWWKEGMFAINNRGGFSDNNERNIFEIERGKVFQDLASLNKYSAWEVKNACRLRALQILEDRISELNEGWEKNTMIDEVFFLCFDIMHMKVDVFKTASTCHVSYSQYFKSKEIGHQLLAELGEDFIKQALNF